MYKRRRQFRVLCSLNGWQDHVPGQGTKTTDLSAYRGILYKTTCFKMIWCSKQFVVTKIYTGYLISCLKVFKNLLFAGMQDGQIKVWRVCNSLKDKKAFRILEGHEEQVTCIDAYNENLVSASLDHSIRVWNISTGGMIRVLRDIGSPVLQVKLTGNRLISLAALGRIHFWTWNGPLNIEQTHHTTLEPGDHDASVILDEDYIAVARPVSGQLAIYNGQNGRRLWQKEVAARTSFQSFALWRSLACMACGASVEVWSLAGSCSRLVILDVNLANDPGSYVKELALSDCLIVGMLSTGQLSYFWSLSSVLAASEGSLTPDLVLFNTEPSWKSLALYDANLAYSLERKFGDVKVYSFCHERPAAIPSLKEEDIPDLK
jgi:WD40 repeat protein